MLGFSDRLALARLPPLAEASTDLSARKAPVLFGWAEQERAKHDLRPDGDPTQGAGAVKSGGTRATAREEPDLSGGGWRGTRHQSPCSGRRPDGRRNPVLETCQPG